MSDKPERNDPCLCGSGRKYKNCCLEDNNSSMISRLKIIGLVVAIILGLLFVGMTLFNVDNSPDCPPGSNWSVAHQHCH